MATQMAPDVQARIRSLPGNNKCCDCDNINPQWASISYGCLMCLECSGHHRSMGVHLSFVRSIQMDSWTEKQIMAMEKSGGNDKLVQFFKSKGIDKTLSIPKKYNAKQAEYYRNRLSRWLEGKTEPPPDPGMYNPETGGGDAQGAEALPGETTEQYNARQARMREDARERMRAKFGQQGMSGIGSGGMGSQGNIGSQQEEQAGLGALLGKAGNFMQNNVVENERLRSSVGSVGNAVGGIWNSIKEKASDDDLGGKLARNASFQEGSTLRSSLGGFGGAVGGLLNKARSGTGDMLSTELDCSKGHSYRVEMQHDVRCEVCGCNGTRYMCSRCFHSICPKCFEKPQPTPMSMNSSQPQQVSTPTVARASSQSMQSQGSAGFSFEDDDWGSAPSAAPQKDMAALQRELGINLKAPTPTNTAAPGMGPGASPFRFSGVVENPGAPTPAPAPVPAARPAQPELSAKAEPVKPKPKAVLPTDDDFFGEFGL